MHNPQVVLRPINPATSSKTLLASIEFPFASSSTSRLDYALPSAEAYVSDFEDLNARKYAARPMPRVPKHRPQRRSWSGDPFARRALRCRNAEGRTGSSKGAHFGNASANSTRSDCCRSSTAERHAGINNTLTWRGATFPWVSRFAVQK